ncbi:MAG: Rpn family recombination-promoting nuclease/putative transposase [Chloroflexota bacterium]
MARKKRNQKTKAKPTKKSNRVQNPHDRFFRRLFSFIEHAREFIKGFLPSDIVALMQLGTLAYVNETYIDESLANHMTDLLFQVRLHPKQSEADEKPESAEIYLLFDHKSHPESTILEQFLRYMNQRWEFDRKNGLKPRVIIPIVFYHGKEGWHVKRKFVNTFEHVDPSLHKFIPNFEYILVNVGKQSDDEILQRVDSGSLQSGLLALKYISDKGLETRLNQILTPLQRAKYPMERLRPLLESMLHYLTGTKNRVSDKALNQAVQTVFAEEAEIMDSILDRWAEKARQEALQEAEKEFQQKLEAAQQKTLTKQRNSILGILNHLLLLNEADEKQITEQLEWIDDDEALDRLINAALEASREGLAHFMIKLIAERQALSS